MSLIYCRTSRVSSEDEESYRRVALYDSLFGRNS